jgi:hypothetical protein
MTSGYDSDWLVNSLIHGVARLPNLAKFEIQTLGRTRKAHIPYGLFANISKLSVLSGCNEHVSFFISEMATAIGNCPQLRSLDACYMPAYAASIPPPTLNALFAKIPTNNPLRLEHLSMRFIDATIDQATLPHLKNLISFQF